MLIVKTAQTQTGHRLERLGAGLRN